jgi:lipoic acid synthetase
MKQLQDIPIVSGQKYETPQGGKAIRHGIKDSGSALPKSSLPKPPWLRVRPPSGQHYEDIRRQVQALGLNTVCQESLCPNIAECWGRGTATLMLLGSVCTRACRFCAVDTGNPKGWLDPGEPSKVAGLVRHLGLQYVVFTSVDRDDLPDGGASHYAECIRATKCMNPKVRVEALTPDFAGNTRSVETVVDGGVDVYAQNLETVERLTRQVRDPRAGYQQTLNVLAHAKHYQPTLLTKSSLMVGLGETELEVERAFDDLKSVGVDIVTLGQYLQPTSNHWPVMRYVSPDEFGHYRNLGMSRGFLDVVAGPFVRSSYRAEQVFGIHPTIMETPTATPP